MNPNMRGERVIGIEELRNHCENVRQMLDKQRPKERRPSFEEIPRFYAEEMDRISRASSFTRIHLSIEALLTRVKMDELALCEGRKRMPKEIAEWMEHHTAMDKELVITIDKAIREIEKIDGFPSDMLPLEGYVRELDSIKDSANHQKP